MTAGGKQSGRRTWERSAERLADEHGLDLASLIILGARDLAPTMVEQPAARQFRRPGKPDTRRRWRLVFIRHNRGFPAYADKRKPANASPIRNKADGTAPSWSTNHPADPRDVTVCNNLGDLFAGAGKTADAIDQYLKLGELYRADGLSVKAIARFIRRS
jgi:hypothetical protein